MHGSRSSSVVAGVAGGSVVLVVGVLLIATGVLHTGGGTTETVVQQAGLAAAAAPASSRRGDGFTVESIYKRDAPGVVFIQSQIVQPTQSAFGPQQDQQGVATGSGFVLDKDGHILTNAHVVQGAKRIGVRFGSGDLIDAKLVGTDPSTDLAVLKVSPGRAKLVPLLLGDSSKVRVGDPAVAIGNPFGYDRTVTTGIVSALQRQIEAPNGFRISNVLQTDAAINPGNSGGPLLDGAGRVIGINSQIATGGSGGNTNVGIGFAVPIDTAKAVIPQLIGTGKVSHAYLGITTAPITAGEAKSMNLPATKGALVQQVVKDGPAAHAGLKPGGRQTASGLVIGGDLIVRCAGHPISNSDDVAVAVASHKPGDQVDVEYYRGNALHTSKVTLGNRPSSFDAAQQGQSGQRGSSSKLPFPFPSP